MNFSQIYGNDEIKKALVTMVQSGKIPHAILFTDKDGGSAFALIQAFVKYLICENRQGSDSCCTCSSCRQIEKMQYSDVSYIYPITSSSKLSAKAADLVSEDFYPYFKDLAISNPYFLEENLSQALGIEKKVALISAKEARAVLQKVAVSTLSGTYRLIVVLYPEKMNQSAANILLKELEEPQANTIFLLLSHNAEQILATIRSRTVQFALRPNTAKELKDCLLEYFSKDEQEIEEISLVATCSIGKALQLLQEKEGDNPFFVYYKSLLDKLLARDYLGILSLAEELSQLDSRERQRAFCSYCAEGIRNILMLKMGLETLTNFPQTQKEYYLSLSQRFTENFCQKAILKLDKASMYLERNVNQKIVFCMLLSRMFFSI